MNGDGEAMVGDTINTVYALLFDNQNWRVICSACRKVGKWDDREGAINNSGNLRVS